jgi:hypothetical protein
VHPDLATMTERATRLRAEVVGGSPTDELLTAVDDALADGYALALHADAWAMRVGQRLHDLINEAVGSDRDRRLRALSDERTCCQRELDDLRRALVGLRAARDGLRDRSRATSA